SLANVDCLKCRLAVLFDFELAVFFSILLRATDHSHGHAIAALVRRIWLHRLLCFSYESCLYASGKQRDPKHAPSNHSHVLLREARSILDCSAAFFGVVQLL